MKILVILVFILSISVQGCHTVIGHNPQRQNDPEKRYFNQDFGGAIDVSGLGDWMEIRLRQPKDGTTDGWLVNGEGESYISNAPVKYKIKYVIQGFVPYDDPSNAKLNFTKCSEFSDGKICSNYIVNATSDAKVFNFVLATQNGNVITKGKLFQMNTLYGEPW